MPLGDHLSPHKQVEFALVQRIERALEIIASTDGVAVQAPDAGLWKQAVQQFFQLLGSGPEELYILAAALSADLRHRGHKTAVVADHAMRALMVGHGDGAVSALQVAAASAAQHQRRVSTAVE